jgi:hypothetical protein
MGCDYLIETSIIIEYYSKKGEVCKIVTNTKRKRGFIDKIKYKSKKLIKKLDKKISKNCYTKNIYEDNKWIKDIYQEKYERKLKLWYPEIDKFIKIYKDSISWAVNSIAYY